MSNSLGRRVFSKTTVTMVICTATTLLIKLPTELLLITHKTCTCPTWIMTHTYNSQFPVQVTSVGVLADGEMCGRTRVSPWMRFSFGLAVDDNILAWVKDVILRGLQRDRRRLRHLRTHGQRHSSEGRSELSADHS